MSDFQYQNTQKLFRVAELFLSDQARREVELIGCVTEATQRDLSVLDDAKKERHDLEQRIRELESALSELAYWAKDIAGDCDDPIKSQQEDEMMERINKILEKDDE